MSKKIKIKTSFGYGTAYEKALLFDYAKEWVGRYNIKNVLEYPANNLMGNNNEIFEKTLGEEHCGKLEKNGKTEREYDLVWCFCEFENYEDSQKFIRDMLDRSNKYVLIITQNYLNLGMPVHRFWHILLGRKWDHGIISKSSSMSIKRYVRDNKIVEKGVFDCPLFYFDIYETFSDIKRLLNKEDRKDQEFIISRSLFEKLPYLAKTIICHHNYLIIKK